MLARQLWIGTAVEFVLYGATILHYCEGECAPVTVALLVVLVFVAIRLVLTAASFAIAGFAGAPRLPENRIGVVGSLVMYVQECVAFLLTFCVLQPLEAWLGLREPPPGARRSSTPIVLVHGFVGNGAVWWSLRRRLLRIGIDDVYTVNLEPTTAGIEELGHCLKARVEEVLRDSAASKVILVGHSMGGLVSRVYVEALGGRDRVRGIITLGTPHHGTVLARLLTGANVRQMRVESDWLAKLNATEPDSQHPPLVSIFSHHDNIVAPQETSRLAWADNRTFTGLGHMALLYAPQCQAEVIKALQRFAFVQSPG